VAAFHLGRRELPGEEDAAQARGEI
jgi:hypothetical protein